MNRIIVWVMHMLTWCGTVRGFENEMHRAKNVKAFAQYRLKFSQDEYIEHQSNMQEFCYGKKAPFGITASTVGLSRLNGDGSLKGEGNLCELIAVFNALKAVGRKAELADIISSFEKDGICLLGNFGTSVLSLKKYLKNLGVDVGFCYGNDLKPEYRAYIFSSINDKASVSSGVHTMCITKEREGYRRHNDYAKPEFYPTLEEAVAAYNGGKSRCISLIGIR